MSKKLNKKEKFNNCIAQPREFVNCFWGIFIAFMRGVPNRRINDELLKEYFYQGLDDNGKVVLDTITEGSYRECSWDLITEKMEKISHKNKAWSNKKLDTKSNTFVVQDSNNPVKDESHEKMAQMRTEFDWC